MSGRAAPVRTCVGCRERAYRSELLRVVAVGLQVRPDPTGRAVGRGAHLHRDPACLESAERRKAFGRSLRIVGTPDVSEVRQYVQALPAGPGEEPANGNGSSR